MGQQVNIKCKSKDLKKLILNRGKYNYDVYNSNTYEGQNVFMY